MEFLVEGLRAVTWQQVVMYLVGFVLIYLAIKKEYEPSLLLPMGFGAILVNLPFSGVLDQTLQGGIQSKGIIEWLFQVGIDASEALPILLFIGIGAMIDFGPLLTNPLMFLFGAGAQFGIFAAILLAAALGFDLKDAVSIGIIGAADGRPPFWCPRFWVPGISEPSRWRPTLTWPSYRSSSPSRSALSRRKKSGRFIWSTIPALSRKPCGFFFRSL